jgi:N-acetylneuraminic acid mutarotase
VVEEYDPATNSWSTVAPLGTARRVLAAATAEGLVYAIGGTSSAGRFESVVEAYDPATNSWSSVASLGTPREDLAAAVATGKVYAIGGQSSANTFESVVEEYDPATNSWSTVDSLNTARRLLGAAELDGEVYAVGGKVSSTNSSPTVEELVFTRTPTEVFTATGDVLFASDDPNAIIRNKTTGRQSTGGGTQLARDGEKIAFASGTNGRLYRTEER